MCADPPDPGSVTLDRASIHELSNHLAVIVGFIELILADVPPDDPHRQDLLQVRASAVELARLIGRAADAQ